MCLCVRARLCADRGGGFSFFGFRKGERSGRFDPV